MNLFQTAYDLQQRLIAANPDHDLAKSKHMSRVDDSYHLRADGNFLIRYAQSGTENQMKSYVREMKIALGIPLEELVPAQQ